ncbi:hypothetical protein [Pseudodesulfovibrio tunisiensis]|uniref:hypothetical protein n=1 Tax=Pseudodesulfovibrio tunisiensis TaxID=463192 RepID=UPI001FB513BD|nr:hypothetical protein [Pseudodesulfovibrio tunisiensis]
MIRIRWEKRLGEWKLKPSKGKMKKNAFFLAQRLFHGLFERVLLSLPGIFAPRKGRRAENRLACPGENLAPKEEHGLEQTGNAEIAAGWPSSNCRRPHFLRTFNTMPQ